MLQGPGSSQKSQADNRAQSREFEDEKDVGRLCCLRSAQTIQAGNENDG